MAGAGGGGRGGVEEWPLGPRDKLKFFKYFERTLNCLELNTPKKKF